jgi:acyl carrier protein
VTTEPDATWATLVGVFRTIFDDDVVISESTTARDVDGWDSLNHVRLVVAIEKAFKVRFGSGEVSALKTVGELRRRIEEKRAAG